MPDSRIIVGDCREVLATLPEASVHCCVTSPPYWGLRSYLADDHDDKAMELGSEPTPDAYVATMVGVFRAVRRVMRDDATLWLNIGDSYTSGGRGSYGTFSPESKQATHPAIKEALRPSQPPDLKPKDLVGIPWRLAFALQADGWWLRDPIVWAKAWQDEDGTLEGGVMPGSQQDRCTSAYEFVFMLTKRARYYWDGEAIRSNSGAQRRNVWRINAKGFRHAHFATYPEKLVEPCVKAGTSQKGCCPECGAPWIRKVEKTRYATRPGDETKIALAAGATMFKDSDGKQRYSADADIIGNRDQYRHMTTTRMLGWQPGCECGGEPIPCTVLDPFSGAGTTGVTCKRLGRSFIGIELSEEYAVMARRRIENPDALPEVADVVGQATLFGADDERRRDE